MIDPVCAIHGKRWSEHPEGRCLYCCLCFSTDCEWSVDEHGDRVDVCVDCKAREDAVIALVVEHGREAALALIRTGKATLPLDGFDRMIQEAS